MTSLQHILQHKIVAILRGFSKDDVINIASALYEGGIKTIEITLNSENALDLINKLSIQFENKMLVGAGTVLSAMDARNSISAGAKFLISPILDMDVITTAKENSAVSIPGAFTPTEIYSAYKNGADLVKIFPSQGPEYIRNILAPFQQILVMPTGGINEKNIVTYQEAGASAFGVGSSLVNNKEVINQKYLQNLTAKAKRFFEAIK